jgi:hypothetical protein
MNSRNTGQGADSGQVRDHGIAQPRQRVGKARYTIWPNRHPDDQKAEHRADFQTTDQWHDDSGGHEKNHHLA